MRTLTYQLRDLKKVTIEIGFEGENNRTQVRIDCGEVFAEYPNAEAALKVQAPKGGIYPATVTRDGNMILWTVRDCDVANKGNGEFQLTFTDGTTVIKTCPGRFHVDRSLKGSGTAPSGVQDWLDNAEKVMEDLEDAEVNQPKIVEGNWYVYNVETGEYVDTGVKAQGEDGDPGQPGTDATPDLITKDYADLTFPVAKDSFCYHDGKLYQAKQDIQTSEAWTAAHWQETTVEGQLRTVKSEIQGITNKEKLMRIKLSANNVRIRYHYDDNNDLLTVWGKGENGNIRPNKTYKGSKNLTFEELENAAYQVHSWADSEMPLQGLPSYTWWNIFANHGYALPYITKSGHGKTADDVGSVWQDTNGKEFTIVRVSGNSIYLAPKVTQNTDGITGKTTRDWDRTYTITTLSHVSGGTHTDSIDSFTQSFTQIYPVTNSNGIIVTLDGNITQAAGEYAADRVDILQTMNCYDPATIPFANIGATINLTSAEIMCYITNAFSVIGGSMTYRATLDVKKPIYLGEAGRWGANQAIHPSPATGETEYRFCPRCKNQDTPSIQKTDNTTGFTAKWNPTYLYDMDKPIDRMISYIVDGGNNYKLGFASGLSLVSGDTQDENRSKYLTPDNGNNGSRLIQWMGDSQNKGYLIVIDGSRFENGIIPVGTICEITSYFVYYNPDENSGQVYWYKDGDQWVIYAHCQTAQEMRVNLPPFMEGLSVSVVDKTDGATLKTSVISNGEIILKFVSYGQTENKNWIVMKTKNDKLGNDITDIKKEMRDIDKSSAKVINAKTARKPLMTFIDDDACIEFASIWPDICTEKGIKVNCAVISDAIDNNSHLSWDQIEQMHKQGIVEFINHTDAQETLAGIDQDVVFARVKKCKDALEYHGIDTGDILVYPYGSYDESAIDAIKGLCRCGITTDLGSTVTWNEPVISTYALWRNELVDLTTELNPSLDWMKSVVDAAVEHNAWVIWMSHSQYAGFDADAIANIKSLIDYAVEQGVDIVPASEALDMYANAFEVGRYQHNGKSSGFAVGCDGTTFGRGANFETIQNKYLFHTPIEQFPRNSIIANNITGAVGVGMPGDGVLLTVCAPTTITEYKLNSYQLFKRTSSNKMQIFARGFASDNLPDDFMLQTNLSGASTGRVNFVDAGYVYFDTTLGKPIFASKKAQRAWYKLTITAGTTSAGETKFAGQKIALDAGLTKEQVRDVVGNYFTAKRTDSPTPGFLYYFPKELGIEDDGVSLYLMRSALVDYTSSLYVDQVAPDNGCRGTYTRLRDGVGQVWVDATGASV